MFVFFKNNGISTQAAHRAKTTSAHNAATATTSSVQLRVSVTDSYFLSAHNMHGAVFQRGEFTSLFHLKRSLAFKAPRLGDHLITEGLNSLRKRRPKGPQQTCTGKGEERKSLFYFREYTVIFT